MIRAIALTGVACAAAFVIGRAIPRVDVEGTRVDRNVEGAATTAEAGARRSVPPARPAVSRVAPPMPQGSPSVVVDGQLLPSRWVEVARTSPDEASAVRDGVRTVLLDRGDPAVIRECLLAAGVRGGIRVRFAVTVSARATELRVGDLRFVEVVEGPVLPADAAQCIESELRGSASIEGSGFLSDYDGPVDHVVTYNVSD